jgi:hypothetical protein
MPAPGSEVVERQSPPSRSQPIQSGSWFIAGLADRGPTESVTVRNLAQFVERFGEFVSYGSLYSAADVFFREGGSILNVTRVVGPAAVKATVTIKNAGAENVLKVTARNAGEWGNNLKIKIIAGTGEKYFYQILENGVVKEASPELTNNEAAVAWAKVNSKLFTFEELKVTKPAVAETALATGADDKVNILDANWETAVNNSFPKSLGPGQISMPGRTTEACYKAQLNHALTNNRIALLDSADTPTKATHVANAAIGRALGAAGRKGGLFANWHVVPGLATGTTRTVPPSCVQAGILGRLASEGYSPNKPGAGEKYGQSRYTIELTQPAWTETERDELNTSGVNVSMMKEGVATFMGFRTMTDPATAPAWLLLSNARLYMEIAAKAGIIAERYVFEEIDGKGIVFGKLNGELVGMLLPYFPGSLYGDTFPEAVLVNTGPQVNTQQTISERQINAVIEVRMNPFGERVTIYVSKVATTEGL